MEEMSDELTALMDAAEQKVLDSHDSDFILDKAAGVRDLIREAYELGRKESCGRR